MFSFLKPVLAVVGTKNSGKTMTVEILTRKLSQRGYRIATVKHIPKHGFSIDREGTDTWRHMQAGASIVISVAPEELTVIKRIDTENYDLARILMECGEDVDVIILEGFKSLVEKVPYVLKIIAVKKVEEIHDASKRFSPILAYVGLISPKEVPPSFNYINILEEKEKIIDLVYEKVKTVTSKSKPSAEMKVIIDGKNLPCGKFVQEILRKTVLAMVSTLKGTNIKGNERVQIIIKSSEENPKNP